MSITTASQSQLGQKTTKNSQVVTTSVRLVNSGASTGPSISSIIVTDSGYNTLDDTAAATSNSYIRILGSNFTSTANVFLNGTMVPKANITFISSSELRAQLPVSNTGSYAVSVYNSNSAGALHSSSFTISTMPQWLTSATLANVYINTAFSNTISATSDSNITYSNTTVLPTGFNLLSNGYYYGTISSATTYSFDIKATDAELQDTTRTFSLTVTDLPSAISVNYLIVAGGGGGGDTRGGGGGAGGYLDGAGRAVTPGTPYTVTVGAGGSASLMPADGADGGGTNGGNSSYDGLTAIGGGRGCGRRTAPPGGQAQPGGSGGGGGADNRLAGTGTPGQGYPGGQSAPPTTPLPIWTGGGGGGASQAGQTAPGSGSASPGVGAGGNGLSSSITGSAVTYAGGGGGGYPGGGGAGGSGGGGAGGGALRGGDGVTNLGGGGGGGSDDKSGGNGGSGRVVIAYPTGYREAITTGTVNYTTPGNGTRVYDFTNSGTITF